MAPRFIYKKLLTPAPACLLMVIKSLGLSRTEEDLRVLCDCSVISGTWALNLVDAGRKLGFTSSRKYTMDLAGLRAELERGVFPITYIYTQLGADHPSQEHAVVVVEVSETSIRVNDPWRGEYAFSKEQFVEEWQRMNGLTIIVE